LGRREAVPSSARQLAVLAGSLLGGEPVVLGPELLALSDLLYGVIVTSLGVLLLVVAVVMRYLIVSRTNTGNGRTSIEPPRDVLAPAGRCARLVCFNSVRRLLTRD